VKQRWHEIALSWTEELRSSLDFLPLILVSVLIALLATAAGPASTDCHFQSPVSPTSPLATVAPVTPSPVMPQETAVGPTPTVPVLRAVPVAPDFVPWAIGLLVVIIVVGAIFYWRRRREGGEGSA
jgi:hypothetical protein